MAEHTPCKALLAGELLPPMGEQLKEEEKKASSFHFDISEVMGGEKFHMKNQKSYASLRAAWVQGNGTPGRAAEPP